MPFAIVSWSPKKLKTFNVFAAVWDSGGTPMADQWQDTTGTRHVKVLYPAAQFPQLEKGVQHVGAIARQSRITKKT